MFLMGDVYIGMIGEVACNDFICWIGYCTDQQVVLNINQMFFIGILLFVLPGKDKVIKL